MYKLTFYFTLEPVDDQVAKNAITKSMIVGPGLDRAIESAPAAANVAAENALARGRRKKCRPDTD